MVRLFTDMTGRTIHLDHPPVRIVSLVPSQTELLYDLGLADEVVGITKFCVHPDAWFRHKRRVGGTKQLHIEQIRELRPDLVLANKEENVREQIEELAAHYPVWVSDISNLEEALVMIRNIGVMTGMMNNAMAIERQIKSGFSTLKNNTRPLRVLYLIWRDPYITVGGDTFISDMIYRMGWINVMQDKTRYPEVTLEDIKQINPDLLLLSSEPFPFETKHFSAFSDVIPQERIRLVDGEMFSWYGSRLVHSVRYFMDLAQSNKLLSV
ncbi:MAG: cobalamin-binding protein [Chitinophagia bacterium]|nr:cobalamin-binding protein [Chitinophagia bacterium]